MDAPRYRSRVLRLSQRPRSLVMKKSYLKGPSRVHPIAWFGIAGGLFVLAGAASAEGPNPQHASGVASAPASAHVPALPSSQGGEGSSEGEHLDPLWVGALIERPWGPRALSHGHGGRCAEYAGWDSAQAGSSTVTRWRFDVERSAPNFCLGRRRHLRGRAAP